VSGSSDRGVERVSCLVEKEVGEGSRSYSHRYADLNRLCR
jgi:hypothetical protein